YCPADEADGSTACARASLSFLRFGPELHHGLLQVGGEDVWHPVEFIEAADGQVLDETCPIDSTKNLVAFLVPLEGRPSIFHVAQPENIEAFDDHAVGPDFDRPIDLHGFPYDQPVDDGEGEQAAEVDPHVVNWRIMKQIPAFAGTRCRPCEETPERVAKA